MDFLCFILFILFCCPMVESPQSKIQLSFERGISEPRQCFQLISKVCYNFEFICLNSVFYAGRPLPILLITLRWIYRSTQFVWIKKPIEYIVLFPLKKGRNKNNWVLNAMLDSSHVFSFQKLGFIFDKSSIIEFFVLDNFYFFFKLITSTRCFDPL